MTNLAVTGSVATQTRAPPLPHLVVVAELIDALHCVVPQPVHVSGVGLKGQLLQSRV
jgi:hypothetical protein